MSHFLNSLSCSNPLLWRVFFRKTGTHFCATHIKGGSMMQSCVNNSKADHQELFGWHTNPAKERLATALYEVPDARLHQTAGDHYSGQVR